VAEDCNSHLFHHSAKSMNSCPKAGLVARARASMCARSGRRAEKKAPERERAFVRSFVRLYGGRRYAPVTRRFCTIMFNIIRNQFV